VNGTDHLGQLGEKGKKPLKKLGENGTPASPDSAYGSMTGCSEWGNEPLGFRKG